MNHYFTCNSKYISKGGACICSKNIFSRENWEHCSFLRFLPDSLFRAAGMEWSRARRRRDVPAAWMNPPEQLYGIFPINFIKLPSNLLRFCRFQGVRQEWGTIPQRNLKIFCGKKSVRKEKLPIQLSSMGIATQQLVRIVSRDFGSSDFFSTPLRDFFSWLPATPAQEVGTPRVEGNPSARTAQRCEPVVRISSFETLFC